MISEILKQDTLTRHQQLEKKLLQQIKSIASTNEYISLLQLFYSYFGGLENEINKFIGARQLPDIYERRKTSAIAADIKTLGGEPGLQAQGQDLPEIKNTADAFGALYVIEGSTLGGSIISKMIAAKLQNDRGLSFFNGYGVNSHTMWVGFKQVLDSRPENEHENIIEAANNTFRKFALWIDKQAEKQ